MKWQLIAGFITTVTGVLSYWLTHFCWSPILRYDGLRQQVFSDLIFYSNAVIVKGMDEKAHEICRQRILANRRHSAELTTCYEAFPKIYRWWLSWRGQDVQVAARNLIGLANTHNYEDAEKRIFAIKKALNLKVDVI